MLEKLLLRPSLSFILKTLFHIEIKGLEHYHAAGERVVIASNHQSFLDPLLLSVFLPEKPAFAMNIHQARKWYFRWVERILPIYKIDPLAPMSLKRLLHDMKKGCKLVIFPEGRITTSGGIMKIYDGTGHIIEKTQATLLPVHISGAEYSHFSKLGKKLRQRWFPSIRITLLPPIHFSAEKPAHARSIYDTLTYAQFAATDTQKPLLAAVLDAAELHGAGQVIATDLTRDTLTYRQLFTRMFILRDKLETPLQGQECVGVLLPNALGALVTFCALQALGKTPAMLNFSAGSANILHACSLAQVKTILTSRSFVEKAKLEAVMQALHAEYRIMYLEDIRPTVTLADKLSGLTSALTARATLRATLARTNPHAPAVILFTSGSEGTPKGVALSHSNLLSNIAQSCAALDLTPADQLFNAMPVFHSFGLTVGMLLPLLRGICCFLYPSPLHYRVIPELIYDSGATVMLGTDTFFNGYARYAHPYDFGSVRLAVAGAEKLKESTRQLYIDRFRVAIMQGYGVTEASPVIAFNTPLAHKVGSVGRAFPGIECRVEQVPGLERGGKLLVRGANIMLGYIKTDQPGTVQPQGEWYDTGDIVEIDTDGFITILGRAKRFAKIGGEMVSLALCEELAHHLFPEVAHAAITAPDERKGEHIILLSEAASLTREALTALARERGLPDLALPRQVQFIAEIPRLGSGKINYPALNSLKIDA